MAQPISNPAFHYDITARVAILTYYDEAGEVTSQIPAEQVVELYRQNGLRRAAGLDSSLLTPLEALRLGIPPDDAADASGGGTAEVVPTDATASTGGTSDAGTAGPTATAAPTGVGSPTGTAPRSSGSRVSISI